MMTSRQQGQPAEPGLGFASVVRSFRRSAGLTQRSWRSWPEEAVEHFHRSLAICRELGDRYVQSWCRSRLAIVHLRNGQLDEAAEQLRQCLEICRELKDDYTEALALRTLGDVQRRAGRRPDAIACYHRSPEMSTALGHRVGMEEAHQRLDEMGDAEGAAELDGCSAANR